MDLTKFLLTFCVDEVFEDRGAINMIIIKRGKSSSLGMPRSPQVNISKDTQQILVYLGFCFVHMICVLCVFVFPLRTMLVLDSPSLINRILHVLHLYLLSMIL